MFVAFWTVHRSAGFFITSFMKEGIDVEGYEYVMTLAVAALAIAVGGPGDWSIDEQIIIDGTSLAAQLDGGVGALIAGLGLLAGVVLLAVFWRPAEAS
jgi:putative oxidoreductase